MKISYFCRPNLTLLCITFVIAVLTIHVQGNGTRSTVAVDPLQPQGPQFGATSSLDSAVVNAGLDPLNETGGGGENPLSRNYNWNLPLVSLPGRAGMDFGLTLSYNSLVWTKSGNSISFDQDGGSPSPGFRLGFPEIKPIFYNSAAGKYAFLLVGSDGSRTELRQVGTSTLYESIDSSHMLLNASTMVLRTSDGTQLKYVQIGDQYNCTEIKDRNGNYLTVTYAAFSGIDTIVDTLGRRVKFNYDSSGTLTSITQIWNQGTASQHTHTWASFSYVNVGVRTNFSGLTIQGPTNGVTVKMLSKVTRPDSSRVEFSYSTWGQVWKVSSFAADNHLLNYRSYNLPQTAIAPQSDCPRFTERRDWAQYWKGDTDGTSSALEEAITTYIVPINESWTMPNGVQQTGVRAQITEPDGVSNRIYFIGSTGTSAGWQRGLPALVNTYDKSGALQRQSMTTWTQDNPAVSYILNPRVIETNKYDPAGNRSRVRLTYQNSTFANGTSCQLPRDVFEYAANGTTVLRSTRTEYNTSAVYTDRRILGLVSERQLFDGDVTFGGKLMSKVGFNYDETGSVTGTELPVQHDNAAYATSFVTGRGNLSSVKRYDVTNVTQFTITSSKYNSAGAVVSTKDALNHETKVSYADSFSDGNNTRKAFAYSTKVTDPDGYSTTSKHNFDFGAVTSIQTPRPNTAENLPGPERSFSFDTIGRLQRITNLVNNAYTRFEYQSFRFDTYTTIQEGQGEAHAFKITDGHGRVVATASDHPNSVGGFSGQKFDYDSMGRIMKTSNPTETFASGTPAQWTTVGDDSAAGWIFTSQTYDWAGRPLVTTNQDGSTRTASYSGCGCAGGLVVTMTDEGTIDAGVAKRRQQKVYSDVLGRPIKTEILNWQGGSVYSATSTSFNARDQIVLTREYAGPSTSSTYQDTTMSYDGYGRLKTQHVPEQDTGANTAWTYSADDTIKSVTDGRGATATYGYNARHLRTSINYSAPADIAQSAPVTFAYDGVGNRISMTDGMGSVNYTRDQLSRVTSESRNFNDLGTFTLFYTYNLANQLTSLTDPFGAQVGYSHDSIGRLEAVTGANFGSVTSYASDFQYRAWGALKSLTYGNSKSLALTYDRKLNVSTYEVPGLMKKSYEYYSDSRLKFTQDHLTTNSKFDRSYKYDHLGRTTVALSGAEARGEGTTDDRPYDETMTYDALSHLTRRDMRIWNRFDTTGNQTYSNNRRQFWAYDEDGRLTRGDQDYTFDAAGDMVTVRDWDSYKTEQQFDGDGLRARTILKTIDPDTNQETTEKLTNFVMSSVLGKVVSEISAQGAKERSFVHAGDDLLAVQSVGGGQSVGWEHHDPSRGSYRQTNLAGVISGTAERDPTGANAGMIKPLSLPAQSSSLGKVLPYYGVPEITTANGCVLDGIQVPCDMVTSENSVRCPNNDCGPRTLISGVLVTKPFQAFADGEVRFMPAYMDYVGDGTFIDGEKIVPEDVQPGSLLEALTFNFGPPQRTARTVKAQKRKPGAKAININKLFEEYVNPSSTLLKDVRASNESFDQQERNFQQARFDECIWNAYKKRLKTDAIGALVLYSQLRDAKQTGAKPVFQKLDLVKPGVGMAGGIVIMQVAYATWNKDVANCKLWYPRANHSSPLLKL